MSSPLTVEYTLAESLAMIGVDVIAQIREARQEYEAAMATAQERETTRRDREAARRSAAAARLGAIKKESDALTRRIARLAALDGEEAALPALPRDADAAAWSAYLLALEGIENTLHARAAARGDASVRAALAALEHDAAAPDSLAAILELYLAQRRARQIAAGKAAHDETWRATVTRILARLELAEDAPIPERLEALARAVILAETPERAELLGNELRLQVHLHRQEEAARDKDAGDAERWLALFAAAELPAPLRSRLEAVAAGLSRLETTERQALEAREVALAAEREAARDRAAALVLEASLEDLGYQVEGIDETLFSTGGITHFQRPGWGDYYVRLRANAQNGTFNFNVVRAENAARADSGAQKREDAMAEARWCAEFPRLMATLAARSLELKVTRRVEAGELPVQAVAAARLPDFSAPAAKRRAKPAAKRHLPGATR